MTANENEERVTYPPKMVEYEDDQLGEEKKNKSHELTIKMSSNRNKGLIIAYKSKQGFLIDRPLKQFRFSERKKNVIKSILIVYLKKKKKTDYPNFA